MSAYKEPKTNTWKVYYRYTDWQGERKQTTKRGFATKREALAWEREQMHKVQSDLDMTFASFVEAYTADVKRRVKENTWHTKEHIIRTKLLPYFGKRKIAEIKPKDILAWQNVMLNGTDKNGQPYSPVYLKTVHTQLSTIFNHACRFYGLRENPAMKVGNMGKAKSREMLIWTREEYEKFSFTVMDKPLSFYAFEMLYWCGIREGELLALTPADFNFDRKVVSITKSYQRIDGRDIITDPKTPKSVRDITMPDFLADEMKDFIGQMYGIRHPVYDGAGADILRIRCYELDIAGFLVNGCSGVWRMQPHDEPVYGRGARHIDNGLIPIVAYNYGAKKPERIHAALKWAMVDSVLFYAPFLLVLELFPTTVLRLFNASTFMMDIGIQAVRILAVAWLIAIPALVISSALQGLSLPNPSMALTLLRQVVLPVLLALLLRMMGKLTLIWTAFALAEAICSPLAVWVWRRNGCHWQKDIYPVGQL